MGNAISGLGVRTASEALEAVGVMLDFAVNIGAVEQVSPEFPWAVGTVITMVVIGVGLTWAVQRQTDPIRRRA